MKFFDFCTAACIAAAIFISTCADQADAAGVVYRGRTYYGRQCSSANCAMCNFIQAGLVRQRTVTTPRVTRQRTVVRATQPVVVAKTRTVYRNVQRRVPVRVKRCNGRQCWFETVYQMRTVREPVVVPLEEAKPEPAKPEPVKQEPDLSTPDEALEAVFMLLPSGGLFIDVGCGEGKVLEAAHERGFRCIGIEVDRLIARRARQRLGRRAVVVEADATQVSLANADVVYLYQFPDLIADLELPETATIVSYQHRFRGSKKIQIEGHTFYLRRP